MPRGGVVVAPARACTTIRWRAAVMAMIATHYEVDFSEHYLADFAAARGLGFLGWNTRYRGNGACFRLEQAVGDIGVGVRWLRETAGVETVVILGNSGGASLMGAYQSRALDLPDELPTGELFISLCAHPGRPDVLTTWLDPAVVDERDPIPTDPSLDMFDPDERAAVLARVRGALYRAAQVARNDRITAWCLRRARPARARPASPTACSPSPQWADLRFLDLALDPSTGRSGATPAIRPSPTADRSGSRRACSLRTWLDMWSLAESQCRATPHLGRITARRGWSSRPGDQGCFLSDARAIYDELGSTDKRLELVPGDHYLRQPDGARRRWPRWSWRGSASGPDGHSRVPCRASPDARRQLLPTPRLAPGDRPAAGSSCRRGSSAGGAPRAQPRRRRRRPRAWLARPVKAAGASIWGVEGGGGGARSRRREVGQPLPEPTAVGPRQHVERRVLGRGLDRRPSGAGPRQAVDVGGAAHDEEVGTGHPLGSGVGDRHHVDVEVRAEAGTDPARPTTPTPAAPRSTSWSTAASSGCGSPTTASGHRPHPGPAGATGW